MASERVQVEGELLSESYGTLLTANRRLNDIRETIAGFAQALRDACQHFASSESVFAAAREATQAIQQQIGRLRVAAENSYGEVTQLDQTSGQITEIVDDIRRVAYETKLLALNASIEAARAGEHGRGFAVVAEAVRGLADQSSEATGRIETIVGGTRELSERLSVMMTDMRTDYDRMTALSETVLDTVSTAVSMALEMQATITRSSNASFIQTVKMDHVVWKSDVYACITGMSDKRADEFADHRQCRLGRWYLEGDGRQRYSRVPAYARLDDPHRRVHENGIAAIQASREGRQDDALAALRAMEFASNQVLTVLTDLEKDM
ncbi:MAG: CZB domain-containing protein [Pseudomonadales bacterium]|nr:CZB domain-containing protein [Pseudomonadales bacterium]MCP5183102.1 CZB domain-containing protein [Pseudomonadales bacterium]